MKLGSLSFAVPAALAILAFGMLYVAFAYRSRERISYFEMFYLFGNIFALASLDILYGGLNTADLPFASVILPIFEAMLFVYLFINIIIFFKLLKHLADYSFMIAKRAFR